MCIRDRDKAQRNFTDPDSRVMKTSDGSFHYCYNAQSIVDDAHQVIVATRLDNCPSDLSLIHIFQGPTFHLVISAR